MTLQIILLRIRAYAENPQKVGKFSHQLMYRGLAMNLAWVRRKLDHKGRV